MRGLLPAAGQATRINGLPKFLLPIPDDFLLNRHIQNMYSAGCDTVFVGTSEQTKPLVEPFAPRATVYLADTHETMSETVLSGFKHIHHNDYQPFVLFGMPDSYISTNTYTRLTETLLDGAQLAVACYPSRPGQHRRGGMCDIQGERVVSVVDKPEETTLEWIWGALAWKCPFWGFIHADDPHVGFAIPRAIASGFDVRAVLIDEPYYDCGTLSEYWELVRSLEKVAA